MLATEAAVQPPDWNWGQQAMFIRIRHNVAPVMAPPQPRPFHPHFYPVRTHSYFDVELMDRQMFGQPGYSPVHGPKAGRTFRR
ncbi:MAG: hypothetical protein JO044_07095 [Mycobacteriaceae bacterium]|nr:hypothetical protein [Mycobacteriaceae bacterium]MBV9638987.1 hypothetical protein [Mycobacteriaceae bacterium]